MSSADPTFDDESRQPLSAPDAQEARRPREVWIASILLVVFGVLGTLLSLILFGFLREDDSHGAEVSGLAYGFVFLGLALALAEVVSGIFVFIGREWARRLAIAICALNAVSSLFTLASGSVLQVITGLAINIGIIVTLTKYEVSNWCRR